MDDLKTEINRNHRFRPFPVTEIILPPYKGGWIFGRFGGLVRNACKAMVICGGGK